MIQKVKRSKRVLAAFLAALMVTFVAMPMSGNNDSYALTQYKPAAGHYMLFSEDTTLAVTVQGSSVSNKKNVQLGEGENINGMHMKLIKYDGWYIIQNCWSGKVLSVQSGKKADNVNVWQYINKKAKSQQWRFYNAGNGKYYIRSRLGKYYLTVKGSPRTGANVQINKKSNSRSQRWHLTKLSTAATKMPYANIQMYSVLDTSKLIDLSAGNLEPGAKIQLYTNENKTSQKFRVKDAGNGFYYLQNGCSNKYLEVKNGSTENGADATQWVGRGGEKQQLWRFIPCGNGCYYIQSALGKYLTVAGHTPTLKAVIQLEKGQAIDAQRWKIKNVKLGTNTYINCAKEFMADSRWKNGAAWGNRRPYLEPGAEWYGCGAYCYDWAKYMYDKNPRSGTKYTSVSEIRNGDIIHVNDKHGTHWFVVLSRNGDIMRTAEGNVDPNNSGKYIARIVTNAYAIKNGKLYSYLTRDYRTVTEAFHMENHMLYDK